MSYEFRIGIKEFRARREEFERPDAVLEFIREKETPYEVTHVVVKNIPPRPYIQSDKPDQKVDSERTNSEPRNGHS